MKKTILIATEKPFAAEAVQEIKKEIKGGYELNFLEKYTDVNQLKEAVSHADALVIRSDKATEEVIKAGKNLKIIVRAGAGYDNIDLEAATKYNVVAMNTPGQNSNAVAELAISFMIMAARNNFNGKSGSEIKGKTIGIMGFGAIGKIVSKYAQSFGMKVYVYAPSKKKEDVEKEGAEYCSDLKDFFAKSRYVSLHIPARAENKKIINYDLMKLMPKGATIINTARKEIICEDGLNKILNERNDFKYLSDVAPDCAAQLKDTYGDRVFFSPKKMGAQTEEANINAGVASIRQIIKYFETGCTEFQVNK